MADSNDLLNIPRKQKISPEDIARIQERFESIYRKPKERGVCDDCGGRIVKRVSSLFRGVLSFNLPKCEKCGTPYWGEEDATPVGVEEFMRKLHTHYY